MKLPGISAKPVAPEGPVARLLERIVRGTDNSPLGVPYTPTASIRCRLGLHLYGQFWDFTKIAEARDGDTVHVELALDIDRPPDYVQCVRCRKFRG